MLIVSLIASQIISLLLKYRFDRPRPDVFPPLVVEHTGSFPSGHTLTAVAVYGLISVLLWQRGHRFLSIISGIWVFLIALSRVYLGAHYPSDVLASLALGTILLIIILFIDRRLNESDADEHG
jgi:undecaprenyl-diphosphatase